MGYKLVNGASDQDSVVRLINLLIYVDYELQILNPYETMGAITWISSEQ